MKILVTGANGLIGRSLIEEFYHKYDFVALDVEFSKAFEHSKNIIPMDILDIETLDIEVDGIIHFAALSRVVTAEYEPLKTWELNVEGTQKMINWASRQENKPWIIYGSSREVYGEPKKFPVKEDHPLIPINRYGISKLSAERLVAFYGEYYSIPTAILRFSNVYGKHFDHMDRVIPKFILQALKNETLFVHGETNTFDFTYISDTIDAIEKTIEYVVNGYAIEPLILHICTGIETSLKELAELIVTQNNSKSIITNTTPRTYDVKNFVGDTEKAEIFINYKAKVSLRNGISMLSDRLNV